MTADLAKVYRLRRQVYFYDLDGADTIRQYTDEELARFYNGTGPASWPEAAREVIDRLTPEYQPCVLIHDTDYSTGAYADLEGKASHDDFRAANRRLRRNVCKIASVLYPWIDHPFKRIAALLAARGVEKGCNAFAWAAWVKNHTTIQTPNERTDTK